MSRRISEGAEEVCSVCSEPLKIFAIGSCNHPVCYKCSTRMRVLCDQMYCAICRADLPQVVFLSQCMSFERVETRKMTYERQYKIFFDGHELHDQYRKLLEHRCTLCKSSQRPFNKFAQLRDHLRKEHKRMFCDICVRHLKVFSFERKSYTSEGLTQHRRHGDSDDKSHKGHPLCEFCDERFLDNDLLVHHLRKDHYFCHFCDADGISNEFYSDYDFLQIHFQKEHFLCLDGDCATTQFTNAFRSEIDLKSHKATVHARGMSRSQARQTRNIGIDIQLAPRQNGVMQVDSYDNRRYPRHPRNDRPRANERPKNNERGTNKKRQEEINQALAVAEVENSITNIGVVDRSMVDMLRSNSQVAAEEQQASNVSYEHSHADFPTLGNGANGGNSDLDGATGYNMADQVAMAYKFSVGNIGEEEFPELLSNDKKKVTHTKSTIAVNKKRSKAPLRPSFVQENDPWLSLQGDDFPSLTSNRPPLRVSSAPNVSKTKAVSKPTSVVHKKEPPKAPPSRKDTETDSACFRPTTSVNKKATGGYNPLVAASLHAPAESNSVEASVGMMERERNPVPKTEKQSKVNLKNTQDFPSLGKITSKKPTVDWAAEQKQTHSDASKQPKKKEKNESKGNQTKLEKTKSSVLSKQKENRAAKSKIQRKSKKEHDNKSSSSSTNSSSTFDEPDFDFTLKELPTCDAGKRDPKHLFEKRPDVREKENKPAVDISTTSDSKKASKTEANGVDSVLKESENRVANGMAELIQAQMEYDFPALSLSANTIAEPKMAPPPGFSSVPDSKPAMISKPPPGFSAPVLAADLFPAFDSIDLDNITATYDKPPAFDERNKQLIVDVLKSVDNDEDRFSQFKSCSSDFRKNRIGPADYYCICSKLIGTEQFLGIFVQLVSLLPDIRKQQELLIAHRHAMQSCGSKQKRKDCTHVLETCPLCYQVVLNTDSEHHSNMHNFSESNFPSLGGQKAAPASGKWVRAK